MLAARSAPEPKTAAPEAAAPVVEPTPEATPTSFDVDDVVVAWPNALETLPAPLRAVIQVAQPIAVENGVIVFGVPKVRFDATNARFRKESDAIKQAFATQFGFQPRFMLRPHDFDAHDALRPPSAPEPPPDDEHETAVDLNELVDAPAEALPDTSLDLLKNDLGAQVVEERKRD
jgi:hypothetical protein